MSNQIELDEAWKRLRNPPTQLTVWLVYRVYDAHEYIDIVGVFSASKRAEDWIQSRGKTSGMHYQQIEVVIDDGIPWT